MNSKPSLRNSSPSLKSLVLFLEKCGITKEEDQLILSILSKLGLEYSFFVSTLYATKLAVQNWRMSSLDAFIYSLTQEKIKLIQMGTLKTSKDHALSDIGSNNVKSKGELKVKEKNPKSDSKDEGSNSTDEGSNFKKKGNKKGKSSCTYCRKNFHNENYFVKNKIDIMTQFLERNNIDVPDFARREKMLIPGALQHCAIQR